MQEPTRTHITLSTTPQIQLYLAEWGIHSRPPLLLLHGLASTHHMFDLIAPRLAAHFHVYAVDQRGHGKSSRPDGGYDFERIAQDIDELLGILVPGQPVHLVGHSWGAYTTLYYAATRPERVSSGVLIDGGTMRFRDRYPRWEQAQQTMTPPDYQGKTIDDIRRMIREDWLGDAYRPELEPLALSVFDTSDPTQVRARLAREHHMQIAHAIWAFDPARRYGRVKCPLLAIYAQDADEAGYRRQQQAAQALQTHLPDAAVIWMPDTIHDIPWHKPAELAAVIARFLTGH